MKYIVTANTIITIGPDQIGLKKVCDVTVRIQNNNELENKMTNNYIGIAGGVNTSAKEAAEYWARRHFTPGRQINNVELMPGALSIKFNLVNGSRQYMSKWDDELQQYGISVFE